MRRLLRLVMRRRFLRRQRLHGAEIAALQSIVEQLETDNRKLLSDVQVLQHENRLLAEVLVRDRKRVESEGVAYMRAIAQAQESTS